VVNKKAHEALKESRTGYSHQEKRRFCRETFLVCRTHIV